MERLTERERNVDGTGVAKEEITDGLLKPFADKILTKLADYEDLEEQGLLVRLPVPLGYKVYWISTRDKQNPIIFEKFFTLGMLYFWNSTVFATREEAEKKLEEMENE